MWPIKKKASQRHISNSVELDGGRGFSGFFFLGGWKPNPKFYKD